MIAALLIWSYAGALFYLHGASSLSLLRRWLGRSPSDSISLPLTLVFGMAQVVALATLLSLVMPLGFAAALILLALGVLLAIIARPRFHWDMPRPRGADWWLVAVMVMALLFCLESSTRAPSNPDTNSYHAQTIRWIETYRAVPGLGNLNGRLAYNSSWLLLNAAFSFAFLNLRSFHLLGGLLFLAAVLHFAGGLRGLMRGEFSIVNWMSLVFIPAAFWILEGELSSPGTDLPAILLTWMLILRAIEHESAGTTDPVGAVVLAAVPALLTVLKLSAAPIMLVSLYVLLRCMIRGDRRSTWAVILVLVLILLPWMMRSVVLSGYLVYPYPQLDLFRVDWKVPASDAAAVRNGILGWARLPDSTWSEALRLPPGVWIPEWLRQRTPNQLAILALAVMAPLGLLPRAHRRYSWPVAAAYAAMLVWFFGAPNWRFGYGVILGLAAFALAAFLLLLSPPVLGRWRPAISLGIPAVLSGFLLFTLAAGVEAATLRQRILLPLDYYPSRVYSCELDGLPIYCAAVNRQCGYSTFPCVPGIAQSVHARGAKLQDGFYSTETRQEMLQ